MDRSKAILVLLALCALQCFTSDNYIVNGDLSTPSLPTGHVSQLFMGGVLGWNANLLLLTLGSTYNSKVCKDMPFFNLDSIPNQMVSQSVMLPNPGKYVLSFEWAPSEAGVNTSTGEVRFNGHLVSVLQSQSLYLNKEKIIVNARAGLNEVRFVGTGKSDGYGVLVTNIKLVHHNLVINGLFSYPVVSSNTGTTFSNGIVGWVGSTVQLGLSSLLNPNIDFFQALSGASVESYSTSIYCATANRQYSISLYWASQLTASLNEVAWKLVWNGQVMLSPTPADYACYFVQLTVSAMQGINTLQLQPQPMGSNLGPVFANVKIVQSD